MKSERMTLIAGLSLLVPAVLWLFSKNDPTVLYPFPGLVVVPALFGRPSARKLSNCVILIFRQNSFLTERGHDKGKQVLRILSCRRLVRPRSDNGKGGN